MATKRITLPPLQPFIRVAIPNNVSYFTVLYRVRNGVYCVQRRRDGVVFPEVVRQHIFPK